MKLAILSHFSSFDPSYALHVGWIERASLFKYFKQDFDFLVNTKCPFDLFPNQKNILEIPDKKLDFNNKVSFFEKLYLHILSEYNIIFAPDLIYQNKGDFLAYNQAIRNVIPKLDCKWIHWIHSSWMKKPDKISYPESLRFDPIGKSKIVYMNKTHLNGIAEMYNMSKDDIRCVYNIKDFRSFNNFDDLSWMITKKLDIPNKDIVQIFPHSATRMEAKGIFPLIKIFSALKRRGYKTAIIFANGHTKEEWIDKQISIVKATAKSYNLIDREDYIFTHEINKRQPLSRKCISDLFKISNLFVLGSWAEVCPNVVLEAKINGNLLCLNKALPQLAEIGGKDAIYFDATFQRPGYREVNDDTISYFTPNNERKFYDSIATLISKRIQLKKYQWEFSYENIWYNQLKPLIDEVLNL